MSNIKKLAGQTMWYGVSSILARMLGYLLTPYLVKVMTKEDFGRQADVYAFIPFLAILFTYGMETAFFRFSRQENSGKVYNTSMLSILFSTLIFSTLLIIFHKQIAPVIHATEHPEFVIYMALILALDTLCALPFALLRYEGRPRKFAMIRVVNILINIFFTVFFISFLPRVVASKPNGLIRHIFVPGYAVGYILIANVLSSFIQLLQLNKELLKVKFRFDAELWREIMVYALPMLIVGLGGMINEVADRKILGWLAPFPTETRRMEEVGLYSGVYKLSILITLFIQAFRMGAEPFFFKHAEAGNPQKTYARVMKFFVLVICVMFLVVMLFLDIWKLAILPNKAYWVGLKVVPILILANMFLGVYYNLSIWYKLADRTLYGTYITLIGAAVTIIINFLFVPHFSYVACAWATFAAYGSMMVISYLWGQKFFPVPYPLKKISTFFFLALIIFSVFTGLKGYIHNTWIMFGIGIIFLLAYTWFVTLIEHKEFSKLPYIGKYFRHEPAAKTPESA